MRSLATSPALIARSGSKKRAAGPRLTEDEFHTQTSRLSKSIARLKREHDTFEVITAAEAARRQLFGVGQDGGAGAADGRQRAHLRQFNEEQLERFEMLKYVRKIEPKLPPLEPLPPSDEPPPDQTLVAFNSSQQAVARSLPAARRRRAEYQCEERLARHQAVASQRVERKAATMAWKKGVNAVAKPEGSTRFSWEFPTFGPEALGDQREQLVILCTVAFFIRRAQEEVRIHRLDFGERMDHVARHQERLIHTKSLMSTTLKTAAAFQESLAQPAFLERRGLLSAYFAAKSKLRARKSQAHIIRDCLDQWAVAGRLHLLLKRIAVQIRYIQHWWRACSVKLRVTVTRFSKRWQRIEREELVNLMKKGVVKPQKLPDKRASALEAEPAPESFRRSVAAEHAAPRQSKRDCRASALEAEMVPDAVRRYYLEQDFRARRYRHLPAIYLWEEQFKNWEKDVGEWQLTRTVSHVLQNDAHLERPLFAFPPQCPTYLPTDDEIAQMVEKVRSAHFADRASGSRQSGGPSTPQSAHASPRSSSASPRARSSTRVKRQRKPSLHFLDGDEELVELDLLPMGYSQMIVMGVTEVSGPETSDIGIPHEL